MNQEMRSGRFTSSQMYRIMGTPTVRKTYIEDKIRERRMKRCLDVGAYSQAMTWGKYMETRVFQLMGTDYTIVSKATIEHPLKELAPFWSGSPDFIAFGADKVAVKTSEVKCYQPKAFSQLADALMTEDLDIIKNVKVGSHKGSEYWQSISNSILCGVDTAEIILYMPYASEMKEIREDVSNYEGDDLWDYKFILDRGDDELAVLPDGGYYKNKYVFTFQIPEEDKLALTNSIIEASKDLVGK